MFLYYELFITHDTKGMKFELLASHTYLLPPQFWTQLTASERASELSNHQGIMFNCMQNIISTNLSVHIIHYTFCVFYILLIINRLRLFRCWGICTHLSLNSYLDILFRYIFVLLRLKVLICTYFLLITLAPQLIPAPFVLIRSRQWMKLRFSYIVYHHPVPFVLLRYYFKFCLLTPPSATYV